MPLIRHADCPPEETHHGVCRWQVVGPTTPSGSLAVFYATFAPGARNRPHSHDIDESMTIVAGSGVATLGDQELPISADETLMAPAGVCHAFVNTGPTQMIVISCFPSPTFEISYHDGSRP